MSSRFDLAFSSSTGRESTHHQHGDYKRLAKGYETPPAEGPTPRGHPAYHASRAAVDPTKTPRNGVANTGHRTRSPTISNPLNAFDAPSEHRNRRRSAVWPKKAAKAGLGDAFRPVSVPTHDKHPRKIMYNPRERPHYSNSCVKLRRRFIRCSDKRVKRSLRSSVSCRRRRLLPGIVHRTGTRSKGTSLPINHASIQLSRNPTKAENPTAPLGSGKPRFDKLRATPQTMGVSWCVFNSTTSQSQGWFRGATKAGEPSQEEARQGTAITLHTTSRGASNAGSGFQEHTRPAAPGNTGGGGDEKKTTEIVLCRQTFGPRILVPARQSRIWTYVWGFVHHVSA